MTRPFRRAGTSRANGWVKGLAIRGSGARAGIRARARIRAGDRARLDNGLSLAPHLNPSPSY